MRAYQKLLPSLLLPLIVLVGCGGGRSVDEGFDSESDTTGGGSTTTPTTPTTSGANGVSYLPLMVYETYQEYSGLSADGLFRSDFDDVYIKTYLINPINSANLQSIATAQTSDYKVTVDDIEISPSESFPILQKVIGVPAYLRTALVFDISGSMEDASVQQLVNEAKDYITLAQASADPVIASQQYTVWVFADEPEELTTGFTDDFATLDAALDEVLTQYNSVAHGYGTSIHGAVVQSIGSLVNADYDFASDGDNDLLDIARKEGVLLGQLAIFSSGSETVLEFDVEALTKAIQSQAFVKYTGASTSSTEFLYKPVFYYVVGDTSIGETYRNLSDLAEQTTNITLVGGEYNFANGLVQNQIAAIERRVDIDNQYIYRFAFIPRIGDHTTIFTSSSTQNSYSLTGQLDGDFLDPNRGTPGEELTNELIEIAGPNGEYIANATISFSEAQTFRPATRWVVGSYGPSDYTWSLTNGTGTTNADGSYTVTSVTGTAVLRLTNDTIGGYTTTLTINN